MMEYLISALSLEKEVFEVSHAKSDWDILVVFFKNHSNLSNIGNSLNRNMLRKLLEYFNLFRIQGCYSVSEIFHH